MKVFAYDKYPTEGLDNGDTVKYVELNEFLSSSDVISLHCPLTEDTYHIIDDDILARLISMPNVIVTSHQAFLTGEELSNIAETTVDNLVSFFEDGVCENEICYRCGKNESCKKEDAFKL